MKAIERYLLREFLIPLVYCILAFLLIMVVYDLFDNLPDFISWRTPFHEVMAYYVMMLPCNISISLPMSMLLALLYCLAMFSKHNELIAMRASGLSVRRLMVSYLVVGVLGSLVLFLMNETIVPQALDRAQRFLSEQKAAYQQAKAAKLQKESPANSQRGIRLGKLQHMTVLIFDNARDHRYWMIQEFDPTRKVITNGVEVLQRDVQGKDLWKVVAGWGKYLDGHWWFFDVRVLDLSGDTPRVIENSRKRVMDELTETPRQLLTELKKPDQMTIRELKNYLTLHHSMSGAKLAPFRVNLHQRYAQPWMCLVMVLLAVSMGGRVGRRGPLVSVASSLGLFFAYWFVLQVSVRAGEATYIPPLLAAWTANLFFGLIGLCGYSTLR